MTTDYVMIVFEERKISVSSKHSRNTNKAPSPVINGVATPKMWDYNHSYELLFEAISSGPITSFITIGSGPIL